PTRRARTAERRARLPARPAAASPPAGSPRPPRRRAAGSGARRWRRGARAGGPCAARVDASRGECAVLSSAPPSLQHSDANNVSYHAKTRLDGYCLDAYDAPAMRWPCRHRRFRRNAMNTRKWLTAAATVLIAGGAHAADVAYPAKPVRIMVGANAGGGTDIIARMLAEKFQLALKQ